MEPSNMGMADAQNMLWFEASKLPILEGDTQDDERYELPKK